MLIIVSFILFSSITCFENFRFDVDELNSKFYDVSISNEPLLVALINDDQQQTVPDAATQSSLPINSKQRKRNNEFFTVGNKKGRGYVCIIPQTTNDKDVKNEQDRRINLLYNLTNQEIDEVLAANLKKCLQKSTGWWTYEFCNSEGIVTQFHPDPMTFKVEKDHKISLGRLDHAFKWNVSAQNRSYVEQKLPLYYERQYIDGDICELNSKPRKTKILFYCDEDAIRPELRLVDEDETCTYIMHVYTKSLCIFEAFVLETAETLSSEIICRPTVGEHEMKVYKKKQEELKIKEDSLSIDERPSKNWERFGATKKEKLQSDQWAKSFRGTIQKWIRSFELREHTSKAVTFKTYVEDLIRKNKQKKKVKANSDSSEFSLKDLSKSFSQIIEKLEKEIEKSDLIMYQSEESLETAEDAVTDEKRQKKNRETFVIDTKFSFEHDVDEEKVLKETHELQKQLNEKMNDRHPSLQGKLKVEIATAYYDPKEKKYHVLKSEPFDSFGNIIYKLFGGRTARNEEEERYNKLEQNYDFNVEN
uniref:MRH domain-containing protein n=1 Tax=Romanomermis culicivorax TaxID=13658 RepID=A0A915JWT8_ROMCU